MISLLNLRNLILDDCVHPLNTLNHDCFISAPSNSVSVQSLIEKHNPKSYRELEELIKVHYVEKCPCGIVSKGSVEDFGKNLYEAQKRKWGEYRYSLEECIQWEYDLFIPKSFKGAAREIEAKTALSTLLPELSFEHARGYRDETLRLDLIVKSQMINEVCAVQVKPDTLPPEIQRENEAAHARQSLPVFTIYYNREGKFINMDSVVTQIEAVIQESR